MPTPKRNEKQDEFVSRCIPIVLNDGTAQDQDQAVAVCHSMWEKAMSDEEKGLIEGAGIPDGTGPGCNVPYGAKSFSDLDAAQQAEETVQAVKVRTYQFQGLVDNVLFDSETDDKVGAIERIANEFVNLVKDALNMFKAKPTPDENKESGMMFWKEADGQYRWIARYSNNFRDVDNPPEIIAGKSHRRFVEMVDKKEVEPPELWLWHVKDWKWGKANWVAYDDSGFALAGGTVDKGFEPLVESLMALAPDSLRVSHGMPKQSVVRDPDDPSIIVEHITREISPLPAWAAANQLTGFILSKEATMAIPDEKRATLQEEWNIAPDLLGSLEAANAAEAEEAKDAGIEQKEKKDSEESTEEAQPSTEEAVEPEPLTRDELGQVVAAIGQHLTTVNQQIQALAGEVKEIKETREAKDAETLTDLFQRAIGHEQAKVDGRTSLAKSAPKEAEPDEQKAVVVDTGNPLVDGIVNQLVTGTAWDAFREGQEVQ